MIDLKKIKEEINKLEKELSQKKDEYTEARESNLKELYGDKFGCENCAYSCCVNVGDRCTYCTKSNCIYCYKYCDEYMPDNELSAYIREHHYYDENTVYALNELFDISDIMKRPELYKTALDILMLRDAKENNYVQILFILL